MFSITNTDSPYILLILGETKLIKVVSFIGIYGDSNISNNIYVTVLTDDDYSVDSLTQELSFTTTSFTG